VVKSIFNITGIGNYLKNLSGSKIILKTGLKNEICLNHTPERPKAAPDAQTPALAKRVLHPRQNENLAAG
jgi:hypothetical protein